MAKLDLSVDARRGFAERLMSAERAARLIALRRPALDPDRPHALHGARRDRRAREGALRRQDPRRADPGPRLVPRRRARPLRPAGAVRDPARQPEGAGGAAPRSPPLLDDPPAQGGGHRARGGRGDRPSAARGLAAERTGLAVRRQLGVGRGHHRAARAQRDRRGERLDDAHLRRLLAARVAVRRARAGGPRADLAALAGRLQRGGPRHRRAREDAGARRRHAAGGPRLPHRRPRPARRLRRRRGPRLLQRAHACRASSTS